MMSEFWDVYDTNRKKVGKTVQRDVDKLNKGEYHIIVTGIIINSKNEILITKRAKHKKFGLMWECNGGSIISGETSLDGMIRELKEELGIEFSKKEAIYLKEVRRDIVPPDFKDLWLFKRDIDIKDITFPDKESIDAKWVTIEEFIKMYEEREIVPSIDFGLEDYNKALFLKPRKTNDYIGKLVSVKIDRPINSKHPKYDFNYSVNYGFVPNTISGDEEEIDCYVLGIENPIENFKGRCIAVIHRINDNDDKLIIVKDGENYTDEEIRKLTYFQEKYFQSEIIR